MKLIHLSDLHLGKRVNEFSMLEDQEFILRQILDIVDAERPDAVLIAGDVYDKPVPGAEAVTLCDDFLVQLSRRRLQTYVISGNHDSAERLSVYGRLIGESGVHLCPAYDGKVHREVLRDEFGDVLIDMLPFVRPAHVRAFYPDEEISSYTDAIRVALQDKNISANETAVARTDAAPRRVLITHQFVTGASRTDSEDISVGGTDNVDAEVFEGYDYVALGHLHGPQSVTPAIRYCGSPLKYSFSEANQEKSVTVVTLREKGDAEVRTVALVPRRELRELRGTYEELTSREFYEGTTYRSDYVHITLTDEEDVPEAVAKLRVIYENMMRMDYDNTRTRHAVANVEGASAVEVKSPAEVFGEFFEKLNGKGLSPEQAEYLKRQIEAVWEEEA